MAIGEARYFDSTTGKMTQDLDIRVTPEYAEGVTRQDETRGAVWRNAEDANDVRYFLYGGPTSAETLDRMLGK